MRIIFSRKGFDSASGGGPSPIVDGKPRSLPIPDDRFGRTTYGNLGLGEHAARASRGALGADDLCHHDPMFLRDGRCLFGQWGAALTHLRNRGVTKGDVFLFFGLFVEEETAEPHHRIYGYLRISEIIEMSGVGNRGAHELQGHGHPHAFSPEIVNNVVFAGEGREAMHAGDVLRLTVSGGPPSLWRRPPWLKRGGLTYHDRPNRWMRGGLLRSVARGQEFVADIGRRCEPRDWLENVLTEITRGPSK